jgi:two-component system CheB/CheR fusion protein
MKGHSDQDQHFIIAIGASAGGIEELHSFFDHTLPDHASYIIIQHLSPDYKSRMVEILSKHSVLKVSEATNNVLVEPNQVYMIPSQQYMTIYNGRLLLRNKERSGLPHKTINTFFNALAVDCGRRAIAVVLSGTGDDGSEGVMNIKRAGGLVIVQDPAVAHYSSMPMNAIATGVADHILLPADMPAVIAQYINNNGHNSIAATRSILEEKSVLAVINLIRERLPFDFSDYKPTTILRRIKRRMTYHNFEQADDYYHFLQAHPDEVETLAKSFMISVSAFFRNAEAFEIIENTVLREIIKDKKDPDEIKIWVVGCATGEEAYSIAILLHEQLAAAGKTNVVKVFATDIDKAALDYGGKGVYGENIANEMSAERLEQYFTKEGNTYRIKPNIRKMLIFAQHNVIKNPPYCNMDLISCRNLLIYMNISLQAKALSMLHFGLRQQGFLFLGSSENPGMLMPQLNEIDKKWKIYRNQASSKSVRFDIFTPSLVPDPQIEVFTQSKKTGRISKKNNLMEEITEILMEEGNCAGVCVDQNNTVVKSFGKVNNFLLQKIFNFDLMELLPKSLAVAFIPASRTVWKQNEPVTVTGIPIAEPLPAKAVTMKLRPLNTRETELRLLLVLFKEETVEAARPEGFVFNQQLYLNSGVISLEEELKETRGRLQESLEKLETSNENMQSFNEELLSANEEMQSANEEMQSVNEELQTINSDYQLKIKELIVLNDDMDNYFRSNLNGQLFVDKDLLLKKFSPAAIHHINLRESDLGRPIHNITTNIRSSTMEQDIKSVISTGQPVSREVEAQNGNWYQMMIMPYIRQSDEQQDGAIISFNEITELKKAQSDLNRTNQSLKRINEDLDNFVHSASHDLLGPLTSIEGLMKLLNEKLDTQDPDVNLYTDMIQTSIVNFKENLRELAEIGKIESEMLKDAKLVNIGEVLDEVLFSIQDKITASGATIVKDLAETQLLFSKKNLRSILYNLISNAVKFRVVDRPPQLHISSYPENGYLVLQVKDNGIGIEKNKLHNVFNIYKRLNHEIDGTGIGLYLVKKIVDATGGMTKVKSEPGKGSTFSIYFKRDGNLN